METLFLHREQVNALPRASPAITSTSIFDGRRAVLTAVLLAFAFTPLVIVKVTDGSVGTVTTEDQRMYFSLPFLAFPGNMVTTVVVPFVYYANNRHLRDVVWREMCEVFSTRMWG